MGPPRNSSQCRAGPGEGAQGTASRATHPASSSAELSALLHPAVSSQGQGRGTRAFQEHFRCCYGFPSPSCSAQCATAPELPVFDMGTPPVPHCSPPPLWPHPKLPATTCSHTLTLGTLLGTPKISTHFRPSSTRGRSIPSSLLTPYLGAKGSSTRPSACT